MIVQCSTDKVFERIKHDDTCRFVGRNERRNEMHDDCVCVNKHHIHKWKRHIQFFIGTISICLFIFQFSYEKLYV